MKHISKFLHGLVYRHKLLPKAGVTVCAFYGFGSNAWIVVLVEQKVWQFGTCRFHSLCYQRAPDTHPFL